MDIENWDGIVGPWEITWYDAELWRIIEMAKVRMITKEDGDEWEVLYKEWIAERKPGYVNGPGGSLWQVYEPSDGEIRFIERGGFGDMYNKTSGGLR